MDADKTHNSNSLNKPSLTNSNPPPRQSSTTFLVSSLRNTASQHSVHKNSASISARAHDILIKIEDEYELGSKDVLGTGFCGSVFMAKNRVTGEDVAVKTLRKTDVQEVEESLEEVMQRVRSECEIFLECDHPNIAR